MAHTSFRLRWQWIASGVGLLLLISIVGLALHAATRLSSILSPFSEPTCCQPPADSRLPVRDVQLTTTDRLSLTCWYLPSHNRAAVILMHGEGGNRTAMLSHIAMLAQQGYGVLICDRRAHGASSGSQRSWGWLEVTDIAPMLTYVQRQPDVDPQRIGVFGFSMGAQIALRAATQYPAIHAVVADGATPATVGDLFPPVTVTEWPRSAIDWLDNWFVDRFLERALHIPLPRSVVEALAHRPAIPLLLIATGQTGHGRELRQVQWFAAVARNPKDVDVWEIPDVGHGEGLAKYPSEYRQRVIHFFDRALLENTLKAQ
ncbi:alpha/beta hydrolase [Pseudanabaena sp. 'Roaring Creek']|uniref:alpha/beta hydrolase n=1 Tax=Pseudanabaena sp. 'Roaring Creek' TaxID=1681830 RepID=UPI0006D7E7A9|nr:alpha/beta fold hydrolase [Pseudanabaena sp. 'Roaring Creek']